jgi:uncharacterized protein (DUF3820 family)
MGAWNTDKRSSIVLPKPNDKFSRMLHVADYLASRKSISLDFANYVSTTTTAQETRVFDVNYTLPFGKHAGRRLIDVYKTEPDYIEWMERNIHKQEVLDQIKLMKEYLKNNEKENQ